MIEDNLFYDDIEDQENEETEENEEDMNEQMNIELDNIPNMYIFKMIVKIKEMR